MPQTATQPSTRARLRQVRRGLLAGVAVLVVAGLVVGAATGFWQAGFTAGLYRAGLLVDGGASTIPATMFSHPPTSAPPATLTPVLAPLGDEPAPARDALVDLIDAVPDSDVGTIAYAVTDARTGTLLAGQRASRAMMPASTTKILTSLALLSVLGPAATFDTTVVLTPTTSGAGETSATPSASPSGATDPATSGRIVLVGGGDPYLARTTDPDAYPKRASLEQLAERTAQALKDAGLSTITVDWDDSWFAGEGWNPTWPPPYGNEVTATSALWIDQGKLTPYNPGPRSTQPARDAATAFVEALADHGLDVERGKAATAPPQATELARVASMPLADMVDYVLLHSDNDGAEVLFHQLSRATGGDGSISSASQAMQSVLTELGLWDDGITLRDGSGLSRANRIPPSVLVAALDLAMREDRPDLRPVIVGLPLAGVDGSLASRFFSTGTAAALGQVHAKTGTLTGTHALAGFVVTEQGRLLSFAFVVNDADNAYNARVWLDRATAAVASCC